MRAIILILTNEGKMERVVELGLRKGKVVPLYEKKKGDAEKFMRPIEPMINKKGDRKRFTKDDGEMFLRMLPYYFHGSYLWAQFVEG